VAPVVALLAACAGPDLTTPITEFNKAAGDAQAALQTDQGELDKAILAHAQEVASGPSGPRVHWKGDSCVQTSAGCQVFITVDEKDPLLAGVTTKAEWPLNSGAVQHGVLELLTAVTAYTAGLEQIVKADTAAKVQTATNITKANIIALGGSVDDLRKQLGLPSAGAKAIATSFGAPIVDIISFGLQQYVNSVKLRALRAAVNQMEPVFGPATNTFEIVAAEARELRLAVLDSNFNDAYDEQRHHPADKTKLKAFVDAADSYDAALKVKPQIIFSNLRAAHASLADALNNRKLSFEQLWPYLQNIFGEATKLAALAKQLEDAGKKT
jgi:hypothetical protein